MLGTLGSTLDEGNRLNLQRMYSDGEITTYEEYWQKLVQEYGDKQGVGNRQAWESMRLMVDGVLTSWGVDILGFQVLLEKVFAFADGGARCH